MSPAELERYLHEHIPLSRAMAVRAISVADYAVTLGAPLPPNINHRETAFGGSLSTLAILAAWSLLHARLHATGDHSRLVIQRNDMEYLSAVTGDFSATAELRNAGDWDPFLRMLARRGRARIAVQATVDCAGHTAGRFEGEFVALRAAS